MVHVYGIFMQRLPIRILGQLVRCRLKLNTRVLRIGDIQDDTAKDNSRSGGGNSAEKAGEAGS